MLVNGVMNEQSLSGLRRERLILLAARLDGAQYVWSQHRVIAEKLGANSAMVKAIEELDLASAALDEPQQALWGFGQQVIESGIGAAEVFERCSRHFTAREVTAASLPNCYYITMNILLTAELLCVGTEW